MNPVFAAALLMLAACTAAPPAAAPVCPAVPECLRRQTDIRTHADLVRALVAERYNGKAYKKNNYDAKLANAYARYADKEKTA